MIDADIIVTLREHRTNKEVTRELDISNFTVCGSEAVIYRPEEQLELLKNWIEERGKEQHNSELSVVSWYIKKY